MIGSNTLVINQETMRTAIQEWLDKRYSEGVDPGPEVTSIWVNNLDPANFHITLVGRVGNVS